jgi:hypothetical protein
MRIKQSDTIPLGGAAMCGPSGPDLRWRAATIGASSSDARGCVRQETLLPSGCDCLAALFFPDQVLPIVNVLATMVPRSLDLPIELLGFYFEVQAASPVCSRLVAWGLLAWSEQLWFDPAVLPAIGCLFCFLLASLIWPQMSSGRSSYRRPLLMGAWCP